MFVESSVTQGRELDFIYLKYRAMSMAQTHTTHQETPTDSSKQWLIHKRRSLEL
jgi:hypothetical protein